MFKIEGVTLHHLLQITVAGKLPRKSNQRRIVKYGDKQRLIKSKEALAYTDHFITSVQSIVPEIPYGDSKNLLAVLGHVYYPTYRSDLSIELATDLMQKAGLIKDDRWVRLHCIIGLIDKENPRVDLGIYLIRGFLDEAIFENYV